MRMNTSRPWNGRRKSARRCAFMYLTASYGPWDVIPYTADNVVNNTPDSALASLRWCNTVPSFEVYRGLHVLASFLLARRIVS